MSTPPKTHPNLFQLSLSACHILQVGAVSASTFLLGHFLGIIFLTAFFAFLTADFAALATRLVTDLDLFAFFVTVFSL